MRAPRWFRPISPCARTAKPNSIHPLTADTAIPSSIARTAAPAIPSSVRCPTTGTGRRCSPFPCARTVRANIATSATGVITPSQTAARPAGRRSFLPGGTAARCAGTAPSAWPSRCSQAAASSRSRGSAASIWPVMPKIPGLCSGCGAKNAVRTSPSRLCAAPWTPCMPSAGQTRMRSAFCKARPGPLCCCKSVTARPSPRSASAHAWASCCPILRCTPCLSTAHMAARTP